MIAADVKQRKVQAADTRGTLRLIQSIPSPRQGSPLQALARARRNGAYRRDVGPGAGH